MLIDIPSLKATGFLFWLIITAAFPEGNSFTVISKTKNVKMPPNQALPLNIPSSLNDVGGEKIRVAILGCGMMGQEHISYISGYPNLRIDYLCDPHKPSLTKSCKVLSQFHGNSANLLVPQLPELLENQDDLLARAHQIDLLVIASPNFLHTDAILQWAQHDLTILVEKPVAVSQEQYDELNRLNDTLPARIWVAMEYRYIPAIAKLLQMLPSIGELKMVTIRENRYPFLHKIGDWNRDRAKTGDTLVEKCCHFWDLFRLITGKEVQVDKMKSLVQRGLNYQDEEHQYDVPIIDSAYVVLPFENGSSDKKSVQTVGCLELCMYAEGSRHQEEIIVTGTKGRLEAYLPENKVYFFQRPDHSQWTDRSEPPPPVSPKIFDCSSVQEIHGIDMEIESIPTHGGYHYSSTSVEWYYLLQAMEDYAVTGDWKPHVSLNDGLAAVHVGLQATQAIVNEK